MDLGEDLKPEVPLKMNTVRKLKPAMFEWKRNDDILPVFGRDATYFYEPVVNIRNTKYGNINSTVGVTTAQETNEYDSIKMQTDSYCFDYIIGTQSVYIICKRLFVPLTHDDHQQHAQLCGHTKFHDQKQLVDK